MTSSAGWEDDREEWDRLWSGRTQRQIRPPILFGVEVVSMFGDLESVTIAQAPAEVLEQLGAERLGIETPLCPICGGTTVDLPRLLAKLNLAFASGFRYGQCVWTHPGCFESCPDTGVPAPIPW